MSDIAPALLVYTRLGSILSYSRYDWRSYDSLSYIVITLLSVLIFWFILQLRWTDGWSPAKIYSSTEWPPIWNELPSKVVDAQWLQSFKWGLNAHWTSHLLKYWATTRVSKGGSGWVDIVVRVGQGKWWQCSWVQVWVSSCALFRTFPLVKWFKLKLLTCLLILRL